MLRLKAEEHSTWFERGSPESGFLRLLIYVSSGSGVVDKRPFTGIKRLMRDFGLDKTVSLAQLKQAIKLQTFLVRLDEARALNGLLKLLPQSEQRQKALQLARELLLMGGPISDEKELRLNHVAQVLGVSVPSTTFLLENTVDSSLSKPAVRKKNTRKKQSEMTKTKRS
jgi:hypothetical protein